MDVRPVQLDLIRTDGGTQPRSSIDVNLVGTYAEDMAGGAVFPPLVVFYDGVEHWLADGFHRFFAAKGCDLAEFPCDFRQGTQRDAILFSVGANAAHGLRRTNEDKRRAVMTLLRDPAWAAWSDREIARHCAVDNKTVSALRPKPTEEVPQIGRQVTRNGTTYPMKTDAIGKRPASEAAVDPGPTAAQQRQPSWDDDAIRDGAALVRADLEENGFISNALRDLFAAFDRLPPPMDAASRFPDALRHIIRVDQARAVAAWLTAFASHWPTTQENDNVPAE